MCNTQAIKWDRPIKLDLLSISKTFTLIKSAPCFVGTYMQIPEIRVGAFQSHNI